jgi:hypothetical protein
MVYTLTEEYNDEERLQGIFDRISFFKKKTFNKLTNLKTDIRRSMITDYPFMAKL